MVKASGLFDPRWYAERTPGIDEKGALKHYLALGWREGRAPGPEFDGDWYQSAYEDVAAADINPLVHTCGTERQRADYPGFRQLSARR